MCEIAVIIATYNRRDMLKKALLAYNHQTFRDFEVIIASDGSSDGTSEMVFNLKSSLRYPISFLSQEDRGFRKCRIVNQAILATRSPWIVFADDDMIPPPFYLEKHRQKLAPSTLVFAKYLPVFVGDPLFEEENIVNLNYMKRFKLSDFFHLLYWKWKYRLYFWNHHPTRPKLNGCNFSVDRASLLAINGLDNDFSGWGYEDDDLRRRLLKSGVSRKECVLGGWVFNLGYETKAKTTTDDSKARYNKSLAYDESRPVFCSNGLSSFIYPTDREPN